MERGRRSFAPARLVLRTFGTVLARTLEHPRLAADLTGDGARMRDRLWLEGRRGGVEQRRRHVWDTSEQGRSAHDCVCRTQFAYRTGWPVAPAPPVDLSGDGTADIIGFG